MELWETFVITATALGWITYLAFTCSRWGDAWWKRQLVQNTWRNS